MNGPSQHLSWKELACKDGTAYPSYWRGTRAIQLAEVFELIRREVGDKPIKVFSAYRTKAHNSRINGAQFSQHLEGRALDLQPPIGMKLDQFYALIKKLVPITAIKGLGKYRTFVHVDIRPSTKLITWSGFGVKDSIT